MECEEPRRGNPAGEGGNRRPVLGRKLPLRPLQEPPSDTGPVSESGETLWEELRIPPDPRAGTAQVTVGGSLQGGEERKEMRTCVSSRVTRRNPKVYLHYCVL